MLELKLLSSGQQWSWAPRAESKVKKVLTMTGDERSSAATEADGDEVAGACILVSRWSPRTADVGGACVIKGPALFRGRIQSSFGFGARAGVNVQERELVWHGVRLRR